ncbi:hypothetical protein Pmani_026733 [Petrolisthes manimaculis]|uniref:Uncharacterized protein n=1 Tax=Petrolisthes manimaculis TaxID=1843537 RepID=A0AAE1P562_9EUCA|nr:hypothetical protein Pmani_026733 [Petrolisthes manimaculis]
MKKEEAGMSRFLHPILLLSSSDPSPYTLPHVPILLYHPTSSILLSPSNSSPYPLPHAPILLSPYLVHPAFPFQPLTSPLTPPSHVSTAWLARHTLSATPVTALST